ncbi:hypothetical protein EDB85DRAFT_1981231 [Lactarius pseudohatsudake]|nr:hypothetical protein EDB85DRAFT_1981231 [Lactarius pseudohatsudake]
MSRTRTRTGHAPSLLPLALLTTFSPSTASRILAVAPVVSGPATWRTLSSKESPATITMSRTRTRTGHAPSLLPLALLTTFSPSTAGRILVVAPAVSGPATWRTLSSRSFPDAVFPNSNLVSVSAPFSRG